MTSEQPRRVRRPRYVPFLVTGFVLGVLATAVIVTNAGDDVTNTRKLAAYLGVLLGGLGALAGGALALWFERDR